MLNISGDYNNFQQYWSENTEDEIHKIVNETEHRHLHIRIELSEDKDHFLMSLFEGRNEANCLINKQVIPRDQIIANDSGFKTIDGNIEHKNGSLYLYHLDEVRINRSDPYIMKPCRYFSGWIQYPPEMSSLDELYSLRELVLHDQGAMVELDVDGVDYTIELTQLIYGHTINIMKLAIYDMPLDSVEINSQAISYTWVNPDASRVGINLRKVITGWTLIEEGYVNSNNLNKNKL